MPTGGAVNTIKMIESGVGSDSRQRDASLINSQSKNYKLDGSTSLNRGSKEG